MTTTQRTLKSSTHKAVTMTAWACGGLLILGLVFITAIDYQNGYSIDPTDPVNFFTVKITNGSPNTEKVAWVNTCVGFDKATCAHSWTVAPGEIMQDSDPRDATEQYRVTSHEGKVLGCLYVTVRQSQTHGVLRLNTAQITTCK